MHTTPILPHLHQLVIPTPFPVGPVNVYLAEAAGEPLTLVDTGPRTDAARAALEQGLADLGYTLSDVGRIVVTHAHADHYGLAGEIVRTSGADVYAHPRNHPALEDYAADRARRQTFYAEMLARAGVPAAVRARVERMNRGYSRFATAVSPVRPLEEGDTLRLAGQSWQVLFTPGHTGGLICLYQPETGLFLSNDHLLRDVSSNPLFEPPARGQARRRRSLVDYVASLQRTAALEVTVAWPGHGAPIHDHRTLIEKRLAFHRRRAERLLTALQGGPRTVYGLSQALFPELEPVDTFLAISEVLAHLEWLEEGGEVVSKGRDGVVYWTKRNA